jgi:hypothetical protein
VEEIRSRLAQRQELEAKVREILEINLRRWLKGKQQD